MIDYAATRLYQTPEATNRKNGSFMESFPAMKRAYK
jgi:hypothetical protein